MNVLKTPLPGVLLIEPQIFKDERGLFYESYHEKRYWDLGIQVKFVQDNHSHSRRGTLRGLHYQLNDPQGKLVRVARGEVFDVAVDIRKGSPTFGQWYGTHLSAETQRQLYIPPHFAHGFVVLSETADFLYKCTDFYSPEDEYSIHWNDPDIRIEWPIKDDLFLSAKDDAALFLKDADGYLPNFA